MPILRNARHEKFAQLVATGQSAQSVYTKLFKSKGKAASSSSNRLMNRKEITERIRELQGKAEVETVLTIAMKRKFLYEIVTTPVGEVNEQSPLCQSVKYSEAGSEYKMPCKLRALELDAKLAGEFVERQSVTLEDKTATPIELTDRIKNALPILTRRSTPTSPASD